MGRCDETILRGGSRCRTRWLAAWLWGLSFLEAAGCAGQATAAGRPRRTTSRRHRAWRARRGAHRSARNKARPRKAAFRRAKGRRRRHRRFVQYGLATWYGRRFRGRKTASGEHFDERRMTCAHRTLPFGTLVRVTRLDTRRAVVVRVNDRGPYGKGRIVDLSRAAAARLHMLSKGVVRVRLEVVRWGRNRRRSKAGRSSRRKAHIPGLVQTGLGRTVPK